MKYELTRYVSYLEKNDVIAVYSNFNLFFLKNKPAVWFHKIINNEKTDEIPMEFLKYLQEKEVINID